MIECEVHCPPRKQQRQEWETKSQLILFIFSLVPPRFVTLHLATRQAPEAVTRLQLYIYIYSISISTIDVP